MKRHVLFCLLKTAGRGFLPSRGPRRLSDMTAIYTNFVDLAAGADVDLAHPKRVFHIHDAKSGSNPLRPSTKCTYNRRGAQLEPFIYAPVSTSQSEVVGNLQRPTQAHYD